LSGNFPSLPIFIALCMFLVPSKFKYGLNIKFLKMFSQFPSKLY
jgi:hypothetical protein